MNILYLLSQRPDSTGSGIYTRAMINRADRAGHRCSLVAACSANKPLDLTGIHAGYIRLVSFDRPPLAFALPGMSDVMPYPSSRFMDLDESRIDAYLDTFAAAIDEAVNATAPDIIHSNHLWLLSSLARRRFPDIPLAVSCHGTGLRQFTNCPHLRPYVADDIRQVDAVFALSLNQKQQIRGMFGIEESRIRVMANGFDPEIFYPEAKPSVPPVSLLYAGKLAEAKGVPLLLETLNHESLRQLPVHLHLAGSGNGPDAQRCRDLARNLPGKVTVHGALPPRDLGNLMRRSHLFVLPSFFEGLPLVVIEALASGCRIVATDLPGTRELVAGLSDGWGQLVPLPVLETTDRPFAKDLPLIRDRLARAITDQIRQSETSPPVDYFERLKKSHSWQHVFERVETVYQSLI